LNILDIGANKGDFSKHVLSNSLGTNLYIFEPNFKLFESHLHQLERDYPGRANVYFVALGESTKSGYLYGSNYMNGQLASLLPINHKSILWDDHRKEHFDGLEQDRMELIEIKSISEIIQELSLIDVHFLKIDTQGTDILILNQFLKNCTVHAGVIETDIGINDFKVRYLDTDNDINSLIKLLQEHNYKIVKLLPNNSKIDELNIFFSKSQEFFDEISVKLNLSKSPTFARYWVVQGIGVGNNESTRIMAKNLVKKLLTSALHPKKSFYSLLIKLTK
jgi:FkbM family methyltransferase